MIRYVRHLFTGVALAAALSCSVFASAQIALLSVGTPGTTTGAIGTINPTTGAYTQLATTSAQLTGIAFSSTGVLYGVNFNASTLYTVNTTTGALTVVGSTGIGGAGQFAAGLAFGPTGTLYLSNQVSNLYTVSTATGTASLVGPIGDKSSATIGFDKAGNLFQINNDPAQIVSSDRLTLLNKTTGAGTNIGVGTNYSDVFGLAASNTPGFIYGFDASGDVININTATGSGVSTVGFTLIGNQQILSATTFVAAVPEPSTLALLMSMGVASTSVFLRRKRANAIA